MPVTLTAFSLFHLFSLVVLYFSSHLCQKAYNCQTLVYFQSLALYHEFQQLNTCASTEAQTTVWPELVAGHKSRDALN